MNSKELKNLSNSTDKETLDSISNKTFGLELAKDTSFEWNRIYHPVDFTDPNNFARYGSAEKYYVDTITNIYNTYPYDGSNKEKQKWRNEATDLDIYFIDNLYPKFTGYINLGKSVTYSGTSRQSSTPQYVLFFGGPHSSDTFEKSNLIDFTKDLSSNLSINFSRGNTVEFWFKDNAQSSSAPNSIFKKTYTLFDCINNQSTTRLSISRNNTTDTFNLTIKSGSTTENITTPSIISSPNSWHHYAFSFITNSVNPNILDIKFYLDGKFVTKSNSTNNFSGLFDETYLTGCIGGVSGSNTETCSGSFDEFRFWKSERSEKDIRENIYSHVGGGTNSDNENPSLGVYYRFNEGIIGDSYYDENVLDYSGRISNGYIKNYTSDVRSTSSAVEEYDVDVKETKDTVIYSNHPDVIKLYDSYKESGSYYDQTNVNALINTIPSWILDSDNEESIVDLSNFIQILSSYLDHLHIQTEYLPKIRYQDYNDSKYKIYPFYSKILSSYDFNIEDLFKEANFNELFLNKNNDINFSQKLTEIKNYIYRNIYNNLNYIYKSKGTIKSFRNLLRCFGIDENILKINIYSNLDQKLFENIVEEDVYAKKCINFSNIDLNSATIYQSSVFNDQDERGYIAGISTDNFTLLPNTIEAEIIFPSINNDYIITSSLFGGHQADPSQAVLTWPSPESFNFNVYAVRPSIESRDVKFIFSSTAMNVYLETKLFKNVYNDEKWNFAVRIKNNKDGLNDITGVDSSQDYTLEFYGVNSVSGEKINSFLHTATITNATAVAALSANKRLFVGAHRQNFISTVLQYSDVKVSSLKYWYSYLTNEEIDRHAQDPNISGIKDPVSNAYFGINSLRSYQIPKIDTLVLEWDFSTVSKTDGSGNFSVYDITSGSLNNQKYGNISNALFRKHSGNGLTDLLNSNVIVDTQYLSIGKTKLPDIVSGKDLIKILDENPFKVNKDVKAVAYQIAFEKSMYQTVSEDMIKLFSSVSDLNTLVGHPINNFKNSYKELEILKRLYFSRVNNSPDLEKYVEFYKWIDSSIINSISNLVPASAVESKVLSNVVESHILERNKVFDNKLTTLKTVNKDNIDAAVITTINRTPYDSLKSPKSPAGDEWSLKVADRTKEPSVSSGDALVDSQREYLRRSIYRKNYLSDKSFYDNKSDSVYSTPKNDQKIFSKIYDISGKNAENQNFNRYTFIKNLYSLSSNFNIFVTTNIESSEVNLALAKQKIYSSISSSTEAPSSELSLPYKTYKNLNTGKVYLTNIHHDDYAEKQEIGLQGPFTNTHVGGNMHRNIPINTAKDRFELYSIDQNNNISASSRPGFYRENRIKSILNIKNIKNNETSSIMGNYDFPYEYISINGKFNNNLNLIYSGSNIGADISSRNTLFREKTLNNTKPNKSVIVSRFSTPGAETAGGAMDLESGEYSVYNSINNRNLKIRKYLNDWESNTSSINSSWPSYHQVNKNTKYFYITQSSNIILTSSHDNRFVNYQIPRSDKQYAWISASTTGSILPSGYIDSSDITNNFNNLYDFLENDDLAAYLKNVADSGSSTYSIDFIRINVDNSNPGGSSTLMRGLYFKPDGTRLITCEKRNTTTGQTNLKQFDLAIPWDLRSIPSTNFTASGYVSENILSEIYNSSTATNGFPNDIFINNDGTYMFICDYSEGYIYRWTLSTPWDITTRNTDGDYIQKRRINSAAGTSLSGIDFSPDGTMMFVCIETAGANVVYRFNLAGPWDLNSLNLMLGQYQIASLPASPTLGNMRSVRVSRDGKLLYLSNSSSELICQYRLNTPWSLTSITSLSQLSVRNVSFNPFTSVSSLYIREYDNLYVADQYDGSIYSFTQKAINRSDLIQNYDKILFGDYYIVDTASNLVTLVPNTNVGLHSLLSNLNGPYQHSSWKQLKNSENWISRLNIATNVITSQNISQDGPRPGELANTFTRYREPPVEINFPLKQIIYDTQTSNYINISEDYDNLKNTFANDDLVERLSGTLPVAGKTVYDYFDNLTTEAPETFIIKNSEYKARIFPNRKFYTLHDIRSRPYYEETKSINRTYRGGIDNSTLDLRSFWHDNILDRTRSSWAYDAIKATRSELVDNKEHIISGYDYYQPEIKSRTARTDYAIRTGSLYSSTFRDTSHLAYLEIETDTRNTASIFSNDRKSTYSIISDTFPNLTYSFNQSIVGELRSYGEFETAQRVRDQPVIDFYNDWYSLGNYGSNYNNYGWSYSGRFIPKPELFYINAGAKYIESGSSGKVQIINFTNPPSCSITGASFDSYEEFFKDIAPRAYEYSYVPEYRFQNVANYYIREKNGNFSQPNNNNLDYLEVYGNNLNFNKVSSSYNSSNKFKTFVLDDPSKTKKIKLQINGIKKLLPYNGFYPAERTVQIFGEFYKSWTGDSINDYYTDPVRIWQLHPYGIKPGSSENNPYIYPKSIWFKDSPSHFPTADHQFTALVQPLFAPGILFNSIKSGLAVDWPAFLTESQYVPDIYGGGSTFLEYYYDNRGPKFYLMSASTHYSRIGPNPGGVPSTTYLISNPTDDLVEPVICADYNFRFPFESLIEFDNIIPKSFFNREFSLFYINPTMYSYSMISGNLDRNDMRFPYYYLGTVEGSYNRSFTFKDNAYKLAISNFLAEVPNFFLRDGQLSTFSSREQGQGFWAEENNTYSMDLTLYKNYSSDPAIIFSKKGERNHYGPPNQISSDKENINHLDVGINTNNFLSNFSMLPHSPPYHYGEQTVTLTFTPNETRHFSIREIIGSVKVSGSSNSNIITSILSAMNSYDSSTDLALQWSQAARQSVEASVAYRNRMTISSSINYRSFARDKIVRYDQAGNPIDLIDDNTESKDRWVIQTRWECPYISTSGKWDFWSVYGESVPQEEAVVLNLKESEQDFLNKKSLIELCGFSAGSRNIGRPAQSKQIKEGIILIPYILKTDQPRQDDASTILPLYGEEGLMSTKPRLDARDEDYPQYFSVDKNKLIKLLGLDIYDTKITTDQIKTRINSPSADKSFLIDVNNSIVKTMKSMLEYNIPPHLDWITNKNIEPFVMYLLEFNHILDEDDLLKIWQGTLPKIGQQAELDSVSLEHPLTEYEFFHGKNIPNNVKWKIFKVKKKANTNYYKLTQDSRDDNRFKFKFATGEKEAEYSYNWPYDYFSLVEMCNLDVSLIATDEQIAPTKLQQLSIIPDLPPEPPVVVGPTTEWDDGKVPTPPPSQTAGERSKDLDWFDPEGPFGEFGPFGDRPWMTGVGPGSFSGVNFGDSMSTVGNFNTPITPLVQGAGDYSYGSFNSSYMDRYKYMGESLYSSNNSISNFANNGISNGFGGMNLRDTTKS